MSPLIETMKRAGGAMKNVVAYRTSKPDDVLGQVLNGLSKSYLLAEVFNV